MCPSPAAFAIGLGPTNPWLITIAKESLFFRRAGISPALWLLVPTFSLLRAPPNVTVQLHCGAKCSPTAPSVSLSLTTKLEIKNVKLKMRMQVHFNLI
jgi:hypothetical protein